MSNSALAECIVLSPFFSKRTAANISILTIHCTAGRGTASAIGKIFQQPNRNASSNYGIGTDGSIGLYVEEHCAFWCSSNGWNDNRAITIEVANNGGAPDWPVSQESWDSLIRLCADICIRNGKRRLVWLENRDAALAYAGKNGAGCQKDDELVMTAHRWYAAKSCPGNYLYDRFGAIAEEVNRKIQKMEDEDMTGEEIYRRLMGFLREQPTSDYAEEASRRGIESGLFMDGDNDGLVDDPKAPVTRQDLAVVVTRMMTKLERMIDEKLGGVTAEDDLR